MKNRKRHISKIGTVYLFVYLILRYRFNQNKIIRVVDKLNGILEAKIKTEKHYQDFVNQRYRQLSGKRVKSEVAE